MSLNDTDIRQINYNDSINIKSIILDLNDWPEFDKNDLDETIDKKMGIRVQNKIKLKKYIECLSEKEKEENWYQFQKYILKYIHLSIGLILGLFFLITINWLINLIEPQNYLVFILNSLISIYIIYIIFFSQCKIDDYIQMLFSGKYGIKRTISIVVLSICIVPLCILKLRNLTGNDYKSTDFNIELIIFLIYFIFLFIPQFLIAIDISNYEYKKWIVRFLNKDYPKLRAAPPGLVKFFIFGFTIAKINKDLEKSMKQFKNINFNCTICKEKREESIKENEKFDKLLIKKLYEKRLNELFGETSSNSDLRRSYADLLLPYIPLHSIFFLLFIYLIFPKTTVSNFGFGLFFIFIGIALLIYVVFIEYPFYKGQNNWKSIEINKLKYEKSNVEKEIDKLINGKLMTSPEFDGYIKARDIYLSEIEEKMAVPMHPHRMMVSVWLFFCGVIGMIFTEIISNFTHNIQIYVPYANNTSIMALMNATFV
jgi:hypothetical protein